MTFRPVFFKTTLARDLAEGGSETEVFLNSLTTLDSHVLAMADVGDILFMVVNPRGDNREVISVTGLDSSEIKGTGLTRGYNFYSIGTTTSRKKRHSAGEIVIITNDDHFLSTQYVDVDTAQAIGAVKTFTLSPIVPTPVGNTDAANKAYVDGVVTGGAADSNDSTKGLVERATQAEIENNTSVGSTTAPLVVVSGRLTARSYMGYAADAGSNDTYVITLAPVPTQYLAGMTYQFKANTLNTGPSTLNVNTLGAKAIKKFISGGKTDVETGDIIAGQICTCVYDGTDMILTSTPASVNPIGMLAQYAGLSAPVGWLMCDGTAVSRATYANLFTAINLSKGTVTMTLASPGVASFVAHGLQVGDAVYFTTTGALPTGVTANTIYYVIAAGLTADAFEFSATYGGSAVNTSGSQSGVHTLVRTPFGLGDGSTTFNVPDMRGRVAVGSGTGAGGGSAGTGKPAGGSALTATPMGNWKGEETHTLITAELASHSHNIFQLGGSQTNGIANSNGAQVFGGASPAAGATDVAGSGTAHNNLQPLLGLNYIIKY